jgi:hypothetical protein
MATATSEVSNAGASLTPSPTIATLFPLAFQRFDLFELVGGQHLCKHRVNSEICGDRPSHRQSAHDFDVLCVQPLNGPHESGRTASATVNAATALVGVRR